MGRILAWVPFGAGMAWLAWEALTGSLRLDLFHAMIAGMTVAGWLLGRGLPVPALWWALLLSPLLVHFAFNLPRAREAHAWQPGYVRLEGTLRDVWALSGDEPGGLGLLLSEARLWDNDGERSLAEVVVQLPRGNPWRFHRRRLYRLGGWIRAVDECPGGAERFRLCIALRGAQFHEREDSVFGRRGEALRARLRHRAAYYLSPESLAVYLPVVLGLRERATPEAREMAGIFRRVGVAHLFAISGLHVGLLFLIFVGVPHGLYGLALRFLPLGQGWVHATSVFRLGALALVWGYVALIGFPVSAVRAAVMGSLLLLGRHWGLRIHPLMVLALAAWLILLPAPGQFYDLSFQMSFLAYFFLLCGLGTFHPLSPRAWREGGGRSGARRLVGRVVDGTAVNLWLTASITLGMWPLMVVHFEALSFVAFLGNLVMVPLLGLLVLPLGVLALAVSMASLGTAAGGAGEVAVFSILEISLDVWTQIARWLDRLSEFLTVTGRLEWSAQVYVAYYLLLLCAVLGGRALRRVGEADNGKSARDAA